jgi:fibronectin-binding autotransporter adhesin
MNLNGAIVAAAVFVEASNNANPTFYEGTYGSMSGSNGTTTITINTNALAELHGTNSYTGITKVVGILRVFGAASLSAASTLNSGGSTGDPSTLNLATADNGYTMNQLSIGGTMHFSGPSSGLATITFTNGGNMGVTGSAAIKNLTVSNNVTVIVNGTGTNFNLMSPLTVTNRDIHFDAYGSGAFIFNVPITDVTTNATAIANGNIAGISLYQATANGLVVFNGNNNYQGPTTNNGATLLINGDSSGATNVVVINSGGTLGGSGKIGGATTLNSGAFGTNYYVGAASKLTFTNALTLNGNTMYVGTASALGAGDYLLWTNPAATISGSFNATPVIGGAGLTGTGTIVTTNNNAVILHVVASSGLKPKFGGISKSGTSLTLNVTNGTPNGPWTLLQSTNLTLPLIQWQTNRIGFYDGSGNLTTNILNTATNPLEFYILK